MDLQKTISCLCSCLCVFSTSCAYITDTPRVEVLTEAEQLNLALMREGINEQDEKDRRAIEEANASRRKNNIIAAITGTLLIGGLIAAGSSSGSKSKSKSKSKKPTSTTADAATEQTEDEAPPDRAVDKCAPVSGKRTHNRGKTRGYKFTCPDGKKAFVWWSTDKSKWVGDSNYASILGGAGYRDSPEAAASWECGCKD